MRVGPVKVSRVKHQWSFHTGRRDVRHANGKVGGRRERTGYRNWRSTCLGSI